MKRYNKILIIAASVAALAGCSKWTEPRLVEYPLTHPWDTNPQEWAEYTASLREYRNTQHNIVYARFHNSPDKIESEKNSLRSMADSVDIVSLTNADNISSYDIEDFGLLREKGIRILYQIDYASRSGEFRDKSSLEAYLASAIDAVSEYGLDGWSFTGIYKWGDAASEEASKLIFQKLNEAKTGSQLVVFEGDPQFVTEKDRRKLDYVVLDTENTNRPGSILTAASSAVSSGVPAKRLLLAAKVGSFIIDSNSKDADAVLEMANILLSSKSYGGLAVYNIEDDYYSPDGNYLKVRSAIQTLNPSK